MYMCVCVKVSRCCFSISKIVQCIGDIGIGIAFFKAANWERDWECIRGLDRSKVSRWYHTAQRQRRAGIFIGAHHCVLMCTLIQTDQITTSRLCKFWPSHLTLSFFRLCWRVTRTREGALIKAGKRQLWKSLHSHKWAPFFEGNIPLTLFPSRVSICFISGTTTTNSCRDRKSDLSVVDSRTELRLWRITNNAEELMLNDTRGGSLSSDGFLCLCVCVCLYRNSRHSFGVG